MWIKVVYREHGEENLRINGSVDMLVDLNEAFSFFLKKLQKFCLKIWSRILKTQGKIYLLDSLEYKIKKETIE